MRRLTLPLVILGCIALAAFLTWIAVSSSFGRRPPPAARAPVASVTQALPAFNRLDVSGTADVSLVQGDSENVALPAVPGTHRLIHLHQNVPGVLASINRVLADHGVNVEGQLLRTRDEFGYVITDIGTQYSDEVLDELRAMDVTIRLRTIEQEQE